MKNPFVNRKFIIGGILIIVSLIYIIKLFQLQILDTSYRVSAANNVLRYVPSYPGRGLIYDRNHQLVVDNVAAYDLMAIPSEVVAFDTAELCEMLHIGKDYIRKKLVEAREYSTYLPSAIVNQISPVTYARLQEKLFKFSGFYVQPRTLRKYPMDIAANILGYVGEADDKILETNSYYKLGDYIGISGIEKSFEKELRGIKGVRVYLVDVHNRIKGPYQNGRFDNVAIKGSDLTATFDADLQAYGETLMKNKTGSIVALEPGTGEILAMVTTPSYKPSLLVGRIRSENYIKLMKDTLKPLFNRALMASYPPGSTFKLINGLIGLQEKVLTPATEYYCDLGYYARGIYVKCHNHDSPLNLAGAIQNSCNAYFCNVFRSILDSKNYDDIHESFQAWHDYLISFGFGQVLSTDLPNELKGFIPLPSYFDRYYGKKGWSSLTLISLAIGQGELGITPLQLANMSAGIANRGFYYSPHIIKEVGGKPVQDPRITVRHYSKVDSGNYDIIIKGMELAVNGAPGTGSTARIARIDSITVCGKTGTAQNPHGEDHSVFVAFAPKENPQIAVSVIVENGGYGATYAAPIASLMIEKYLKRVVRRTWLENYILTTDLIHGKPEDK